MLVAAVGFDAASIGAVLVMLLLLLPLFQDQNVESILAVTAEPLSLPGTGL